MKFIALAIALALSAPAMAGPNSGGGEGGDKVFERAAQATQYSMDKYMAKKH